MDITKNRTAVQIDNRKELSLDKPKCNLLKMGDVGKVIKE
jgi:hypothetical protein